MRFRVFALVVLSLLLASSPALSAEEAKSAGDINEVVVRITEDAARYLKAMGATEIGVVPFRKADDDALYALSEVLTSGLIQELKISHGELAVVPPAEGGSTFRISGQWKVEGDNVQVTTRILRMPAAEVAVTYVITVPAQRVPKVYLVKDLSENRPVDKGTRIAVMYFEGVHRHPDLEYLRMSIPEAITTYFARNSGMVLIERLQIDKIGAELGLAESRYADPDTAVRVGKLLGASYVIIGSYQKAGLKIRLMARRVKVETGEIFEAASAVGTEDSIFDLEDLLAKNLLDDMQRYR